MRAGTMDATRTTAGTPWGCSHLPSAWKSSNFTWLFIDSQFCVTSSSSSSGSLPLSPPSGSVLVGDSPDKRLSPSYTHNELRQRAHRRYGQQPQLKSPSHEPGSTQTNRAPNTHTRLPATLYVPPSRALPALLVTLLQGRSNCLQRANLTAAYVPICPTRLFEENKQKNRTPSAATMGNKAGSKREGGGGQYM